MALPFTHLQIQKLIPGFNPYEHQRKSFERLNWNHPESTIVATGTGSGKTECFLLPILDYCLANRKPGIKAILIYPMNALATDQAKRVMELINGIKGTKLRAGIYTGESDSKPRPDQPGEIITSRHSLRKNPPDILLTNYKMLDFLLMRPEDQALWAGNGPDVLRYLVVDELHTFDGAQGTDLACLIRRLRERLHLTDSLACVGTSATIGGPNSIEALCQYASSIFATSITSEAVVTEDRLSQTEYFNQFGDVTPLGQWPDYELVQVAETATSPETYFSLSIPLWFGESLGFEGGAFTKDVCLRLGEVLPRLEGFRRFIRDMSGVTDLEELALKWNREIKDFQEIESDETERLKLIRAVIDSIVSMIALARNEVSGRIVPFLTVRSQLWIRTLTRAVVSVGSHPKMELANDLKSLEDPLYLPVVGCKECNSVAWACAIPGGPVGTKVVVKPELRTFYDSWFSEHRDTALMYPVTDGKFYEAHRNRVFRLCPQCGKLEQIGVKDWDDTPKGGDFSCVDCGCTDTVIVWIPDTTVETKDSEKGSTKKFKNFCPHCLALNSLRIFGAAATSLCATAINHLHASGFNGDNKVIAFSDSVQDAALRAGFFNSRDFLATCRHALVHYLSEKGKNIDLPLRQIVQGLPSYWVQKFTSEFKGEHQEILGKAAFLGTFIAPDKAWRYGWDTFQEAALASYSFKTDEGRQENCEQIIKTYEHWETLYEHIRERLVWEALMELGYRSENGRTVARAELAVAYPDTRLIDQAAQALAVSLNEKIGISCSFETLRQYLTGFIHRFRMLGAFDVEGFKALGAPFIEESFGMYARTGNDYLCFNKSHVLPKFGKYFRAPTAPTFFPHQRDKFNEPIYKSSGKTWFISWLEKLLVHDNPLVGGQIQDVLEETLKALTSVKLLRFVDRDETPAWVLPIQHWKVSQTVRKWRCTCCGRKYYSAARQTAQLWSGMPCHSAHCMGHLEEDPTDGRNGLYLAPPARIHASEHTSIIESPLRKAIENNFSTMNRAWCVNTLSATPTLEMGIDIGDLSTVLLCSMPPSQANYLQRIGRAGRRDGNAVALTMVDRSVHDQYFWQDPKEMLEGDVNTPGVFLRAVAVLERQFVAFALGHWVSMVTPMPKLPDNLKTALSNFAGNKEDVFPLSFLAWTTDHAEELYDGFVRLFEGNGQTELTDESRLALRHFVSGDETNGRPGLVTRIREAFTRAREAHEDYQRTVRELTKRIRELEKKPQDEATTHEINDLTQQKIAMQSMLMSAFDKKVLFNFMTDEGLLPNYAFPEEGVLVNSVIIKRRDSTKNAPNGQGQKQPHVETFDFTRAAGQALHELAPASHFYAKEHILKIDQLKITDDSFERWRFCPECSHAERVNPLETAPCECPHCGCTLFGDNGRIKTLLRVRELTAVADGKEDRIDDRKEERTVESKARQVLIEVNAEDVETAWRVADDRFNFGFEFLKRVTVREINFGPSVNVANTIPFQVAGTQMPQFGYKICRHCGKVYDPYCKKPQGPHDFNCPYYDKVPAPNDDPWVSGLFLYREVQSEAIRIRIPVCDMIDESGAEIGTASFIAAIKLGLRKHFKGSVDHLEVRLQTEPVPKAAHGRNRYIVIYDSIPGGSGYLKDLGRLDELTHKPEVMQSMFKAAWEAVSSCDCANDPEKDGCYHCVYQYRDFGNRVAISRSEAEFILRRIANYKPDQIQIIKSVSDLGSFDVSVLENLMAKRLSKLPGISFTNLPSKTGEIAYEITMPLKSEAREAWQKATGKDPGDRFTWLMRAQPDFREGTMMSRPDFVILPRSEAIAQKYPELTSYIFTDGWEFHAKILNDDTAKRQAIRNMGHRVWSLTWQDLAKKDAEVQPVRFSGIVPRRNNLGTAAKKWIKLFDANRPHAESEKTYGESCMETLLKNGLSNFDWLCGWLADPWGFASRMKEAMRFAVGSHSVVPKTSEPNAAMHDQYPAPLFLPDFEGRRLWHVTGHELPFNMTSYFLPVSTSKIVTVAAIRIDERAFEDEHVLEFESLHEAWAAFWQTSNAIQFLDHSWSCTRGNDEWSVFQTFYEPKVSQVVPPSVSPHVEDEAAWHEIIEELEDDAEFFEHILQAAQQLLDKHTAAPDEIVDGFGSTVVTEGQGLKWEKGEQSIYLFAHEDIDPKADLTKVKDGMVVVTTDMADWLERMEALLK